jgi:ABC-type branched-subunit amino acid transport system ATPase component
MSVDGLQIDKLTVQFGGLVAVHDVSLEAPEGRLTGLIGPNGAGKTTIFNACTGLVRSTRGRVHLFGHEITRVSPDRRAQLGLGRTFQRMQLFDSLTVAENVALGREAALAKSSVVGQLFCPTSQRAIIRQAAAEAIEMCGIGPIAKRVTGGLSTAQRRLVELARALAGPFKILLLDEPSAGLDVNETVRFGEIIGRVVNARSEGILLVEHNMSMVMTVCKYIYVLDFGKLIFQGTPAEVGGSEVVRAAYLGSEAA